MKHAKQKTGFTKFCATALLVSLLFVPKIPAALPEEGMYPLYELSKLDLSKAGLKIGIEDIFNPNGVSLINAVVKFGGCTGSFVSKEGLIITNHHCVFGLVQKVSSVEKNYVEDGFLAKSREEEIPVTGQYCQITESYEDVSGQVLNAAAGITDLTERDKAVQKKIKELTAAEEKNNPSMKISISEMFAGRVYILFRYKLLKDIRLVYVPPRTIGEFGGETDNWIWPKHTGDFSFVRAYIAPDGSAKEYSKDNVPYIPQKFLKVNPNGIEEGDFLFILGYPGRTFRNQTSRFIEFHEKYQLTYIAELNKYLIEKFTEMGKNDPATALTLAAKIKSLANAQKNYEGKLKGLSRLSLVEAKRAEEKSLADFINSDAALKEKYGTLFSDIDKLYDEVFAKGRIPLVMNQFTLNVNTLKLAGILLEYSNEMSKPESERKSAYKPSNIPALFEQIQNIFKEYSKEADKTALGKIIGDAVNFPEMKDFELFKELKGSEAAPREFAAKLTDSSIFSDYNSFTALLEKTPDEIKALNNGAIEFAGKLKRLSAANEKENKLNEAKINDCLAKLYDVKKIRDGKKLLPDANSTLRFTYGYVRGYSPADATYYSPMTTLKGVIDKSCLGDDFKLPPQMRGLYEKKDYGRYKNRKKDDLPVAILYNTDTSGGNSGSPIMNGSGELIGVNFDRTYEATINDYAWNENYSRSIGVDIRYVLWVTQKIGGADYLITELGIDK